MKRIWFILYAFAIVLAPPIQTHGKYIFFAEIWLLPVILYVGWLAIRGRCERPPRALLFALGLLFIAFFAGTTRARASDAFNGYLQYLPGLDDSFHLLTDGIRYLRWSLLISLPWLLSAFSQSESTKNLAIFFQWLRRFAIVSAILAILDHFGLIHLVNIYGFNAKSEFWIGREFATFQSPLEAGCFFGVFFVQELCVQETFGLKQALRRTLVAAVFLVALLMTKSFTCLFAAIVVLAICIWPCLGAAHKKISALTILAMISLVAFFVPRTFFLDKLTDFIYRARIWKNIVLHLGGHLSRLLCGFGFTAIVVDNSFLLLIVMGGLIFFMAALIWIYLLQKRAPKSLRAFQLFWMITWFALDSIGYWGIGRIGWTLWTN